MTRFALASLVALAAAAFAETAAETRDISAPAAFQRAQDEDLVIVDVRTPREWRETGLPRGAVQATLQDEDFIAQVLAAVKGDKDAPVALTCRTGRRSARAAKALEAAGFSDLYNIREGWAGREGSGPGWLARGLPVEAYNIEANDGDQPLP